MPKICSFHQAFVMDLCCKVICLVTQPKPGPSVHDVVVDSFMVEMLSLSRAVVSGVTRAPAAISHTGVTVITRFNSTTQVRSWLCVCVCVCVCLFKHHVPFNFYLSRMHPRRLHLVPWQTRTGSLRICTVVTTGGNAVLVPCFAVLFFLFTIPSLPVIHISP